VARVAYGMAIGSDLVNAEIVDWDEFRKLGKKHKVSAVPKTFINYDESFVGVATERSILELVQESGQ